MMRLEKIGIRERRNGIGDIDYKGDWREFSNRITSFINDPEFDVMDDDVHHLKKTVRYCQ